MFIHKTRFVEMLENDPAKYHFLIRPRKFGKSLFLSTLFHYYDFCSKDDFDTLFGDLYIGKNPTPKRNTCFVVRFSFAAFNVAGRASDFGNHNVGFCQFRSGIDKTP